MNEKICFIVHKSNIVNHDACLKSIRTLNFPEGCSYEIASWEDNGGKTTAGIVCNELLKNSEIEYKIYLQDTVRFKNENLILELLDIFHNNSEIALAGVRGTDSFPTDGDISTTECLYGGRYYLDAKRNSAEQRGIEITGPWAEVEAIDSTIVAVHYDMPVENEVTDNLLGIILSVEARRRGLKVVVPQQKRLWCLNTAKKEGLSAAEKNYIRQYTEKVEAGKINPDWENKILQKQQGEPLLVIGIPTYNRAKYLRKSLDAIFAQIGNSKLVEVMVSDNASPDETYSVAEPYLKHGNLRYIRQEKNLGAAGNVAFLYANAKGKYILVCGDDDYYAEGTIKKIIEAAGSDNEPSVIGLDWFDRPYDTFGRGLDEFLRVSARTFTSISSVIMRQKCYELIAEKDRFSYTQLNQVYLQMEIVRDNPVFAYITGRNFRPDSGEALYAPKEPVPEEKRMGFCDVFINEYMDILNYYLDKGLSKKAYDDEKFDLLQNYVLHWLEHISELKGKSVWKVDDNLREIMDKHYHNEPYYRELVNIISRYVS